MQLEEAVQAAFVGYAILGDPHVLLFVLLFEKSVLCRNLTRSTILAGFMFIAEKRPQPSSSRSRMCPALRAKSGSRGKIQLRCCQGRMASALNQRQSVVPLTRATMP